MTLMEQTAWVCGGLTVATAALVLVAWLFLYPQEAG